MDSLTKFVNSAPGGNIQVGLSEENGILSSLKETHHCTYPQCTFSSTWKSSLSMHMKTHTDERPWKCAVCDKHFKLKHHLKHHILTHSQHKPFKCNLCDYSTTHSYSLQRHRVNKHRLLTKRRLTTKSMSLPTMVSMTSQRPYQATTEQFLRNFMEQQTVRHNPESEINFQTPLTTQSMQQMPIQLNNLSALKQISNGNTDVKIMNIRSVSESSSQSIPRRTSQPDDGAVIVINDEVDRFEIPTISSPEGIPLVKEELPQYVDSPESSLQRTPNSNQSFDYAQNGRKSVDSVVSKSPIILHQKQLTRRSEVTSESDSAVFDKSIDHTDSASQSSIVESLQWKCVHCEISFPDNIMYGLHMGCHTVGCPYQCNVCGLKCKDRHDFMFHFTIGKHLS